MKNRSPTHSVGFLQSRDDAPSLPFLVKGGRKLNGLEPVAAGRAAVTPGSTVAKVVGARQGATHLDYPCITQAPPGMPAAAPSHKGNCKDHLDGQERNGRWSTFRERQLPTVMVAGSAAGSGSSGLATAAEASAPWCVGPSGHNSRNEASALEDASSTYRSR